MNIGEILKKTKGKITFNNISYIDCALPIKEIIDDLKEDMLQIEYPNGLLLDVGWFPSFNLKGCFLIQVIEIFDWENPIIKRECNELEIFKQLLQETILFCNEKVS